MSILKAASHASESPEMRQLMSRFDVQKELFNATDSNDIYIELPAPLDNLEIPDIVDSGLIRITR